ncbi:hypothetical protein VTK26DRAFT_8638 [Humicola hyalothermophila]
MTRLQLQILPCYALFPPSCKYFVDLERLVRRNLATTPGAEVFPLIAYRSALVHEMPTGHVDDCAPGGWDSRYLKA